MSRADHVSPMMPLTPESHASAARMQQVRQIAHDFNNSLTVISMISESLAGNFPPSPVAADLRAACEMLSALTRRLFALADLQIPLT